MEVTFVITNQGFQRACVERAAEPLHFFISMFLFAVKTRIKFNQVRRDTEIDCWGSYPILMGLPLSNMGLDMCLLGLLSQVENSKPEPNMAFNCTIEKL